MEKFMQSLASDLLGVSGHGRRLVAIDGVDGSGKTSFAANFVKVIQDRPVTVIHVDDFLNPSAWTGMAGTRRHRMMPRPTAWH